MAVRSICGTGTGARLVAAKRGSARGDEVTPTDLTPTDLVEPIEVLPGLDERGLGPFDPDEVTAEPDIDDEADERRRRPLPAVVRWWARREWPLYLASLCFTLFTAAQALDIWSADLTAPFAYSNDATAVIAHFKTVLETGWYEYQPRLGAPLGQNYHDFPQADNLHMMVAWLLGHFTSNVAVVINVYYLLGFPLAALAAVWFLRRLGVSKVMTLVLSVLFALAPFHWEKGENHLFLAAYFPVPLALVVVFWTIRGEPLWRFRPGSLGRGLSRIRCGIGSRGVATLLILALIGTASSYYSVFILLMLATAGLIALIRTHSWRRFGGAVMAGAALAGVMFLNMLPDILYSIAHGNNVGALVRDDSETERYALKIAQLILPAPDHQLKAFRQLRQWYDTTYPFISERPALGLVAALGFLGLLAFLLIRVGSIAGAAGKEARLTRRQSWLRQSIGYLALLNLVALLFSTMGGFETIVSFFTHALRSWNRMSILIAAFSLAAFGLAVDAFVRWVGRRCRFRAGRSRLLTAVVAATILVIGVWDQSTLRAIPAYASVAAQWNADQTWVNQLETALPDNAMVFQLAYQAYPEAASVNGVVYTDSLKPFLHSTTLRWSAGGMRGRAADDWNLLVAAEASPRMVADLAATGFEGIMIDRRTYVDAGASIEQSLNKALGKSAPDLISATTRYTYYSLAGERTWLEAAHTPAEISYAALSILQPVFLYISDEYTPGQNTSKQGLWTSKQPTAPLILDNARGVPVQIALSMVLTSPTAATQVMLTSGQQSWVVNLSSAAASAITLDFAAQPGRTDFVLSPGPDALNVDGDTSFAVANVSVVDVDRPNLAATVACAAEPRGENC